MNATEAARVLEEYYALREKCWLAATAAPEQYLGELAWLSHHIMPGDVSMFVDGDGLCCMGQVYSARTDDFYHFSFFVLLADLEGVQ